MTRTEFQALPYKPARQWLREQGHKVSDNANRDALNSIYDVAHGLDSEPTPKPVPRPEPVEDFDDFDPFSDDETDMKDRGRDNGPTITETPATIKSQPVMQTPDNTHEAATMLATALTAMMQPRQVELNEPRVIELIKTHAAGPRQIEFIRKDLPKVKIETAQHYKFPLLYACLELGIHVMLVGEAGSGKTTAAHNAATALSRDFYAQSFCATTSKADLQGYMNAAGEYVQTNFRRSYEGGGIFCADEFDAGNPNTNAVINAALANSTAGFPDGMIDRHESFTVVACANTFGKGANAKYVGRNKLDAATLDRFATIQWDIDEALEASFLGIQTPQQELKLNEGGIIEPSKWLEICRKARAKAMEIGAEMIVSPRAVQAGAKLSACGIGKAHLLEMFIYRGADAATRDKLKPALA